jgi:hypothetical protein
VIVQTEDQLDALVGGSPRRRLVFHVVGDLLQGCARLLSLVGISHGCENRDIDAQSALPARVCGAARSTVETYPVDGYTGIARLGNGLAHTHVVTLATRPVPSRIASHRIPSRSHPLPLS